MVVNAVQQNSRWTVSNSKQVKETKMKTMFANDHLFPLIIPYI